MRITSSRWLHWVLRVLLAALFIVSSMAKLFAIDDFELYIFSYGILSLNGSYLAARLCIGIELLVGIMIALGLWRRITCIAAFLLLVFFSIFLCYAALIGRTDSCQCMGKLANLPPALSLLKNAILLVLLLLYNRVTTPDNRRPRVLRIVTVLLAIGSLALPFCISVPDNWMFGPEEMYFDNELLQQTIKEHQLDKGHQLVALVTPGCPYCRMTREKLTSIAKRNHLPEGCIHYLSSEELGNDLFLRITYGQRPLVLLLEDGHPTTSYHYRNINERQICHWLETDK